MSFQQGDVFLVTNVEASMIFVNLCCNGFMLSTNCFVVIEFFNAWSSIAPWYNCCCKLQRITSDGCLTRTFHIDITSNIYIQVHPVRNTINYIALTQYIWQSLPRVTRPFSANSQHQAAQTIRHAASRATHRAAAWTTSSDKQLIHLYNWEHVRTFIWLWFFTQSLWETMLGNDSKLKLMLYFGRFFETFQEWMCGGRCKTWTVDPGLDYGPQKTYTK